MTGLYIAKDELAGKKVELSDISIRDGLQALETVIDTDTKVKYLEGLIKLGRRRTFQPCGLTDESGHQWDPMVLLKVSR